jgi:exonuclease III
MLEVVQWNMENFVNIDKIVKNTEAINKLKKLDIMFIQEWKQEEGLLLLNKLNAEKYHFLYISIESCCIIYNSKKFILEKFVEIKLDFNIERTLIERAYLSIHEHKTSLFASFRPLVNMSIDILHCVCFHLGAFSPEAHKNLHRTQLNQVFKKLLEEIRPKLKNGVIVSGDTNYRTQDNDLLDKLVDTNLVRKIPGDFKDICHDSECLNYSTQSFRFLHEKNIAKQLMRKFASINIKNCSKNPNDFICKHNKVVLDNRLDFIATNLKVKKNKTVVKPYPLLSDHFMISTILEPSLSNKTHINKKLRNKTLRNKTFKNKSNN